MEYQFAILDGMELPVIKRIARMIVQETGIVKMECAIAMLGLVVKIVSIKSVSTNAIKMEYANRGSVNVVRGFLV